MGTHPKRGPSKEISSGSRGVYRGFLLSSMSFGTLDLGLRGWAYFENHVIGSVARASTSSISTPTSLSSMGMSSISSSSTSRFIALPFSSAVGFGGFHLGDVCTDMVRCFPFLPFMVSLVGVGFDLDVLRDLGTSANTSTTSGAATSASLSIPYVGFSTTCCVLIISKGEDMIFCKNCQVSIGKVTNTPENIKSSYCS